MQVRLGIRLATVVALAALPLSTPAQRAGAVVARPRAVTPNIVAVPVRSSYETVTRAVSRDIGISVALPDGHDLWLFGDTGIYQLLGMSWARTGFLDGSTAMLARYAKGHVPHGGEYPTAKPARFVPVPPNVYLPDKSGRLCVMPNPTAAFSARWPNGAAVMSTNTDRVLVTYAIVCVTHPKPGGRGVAQRPEGWGYMLYNWKTQKIDRGPIDIFKPRTTGSTLPSTRVFGWPVFDKGKLTMFSSACPQQFIGCAGGKVYSVTMAPTIAALDNLNSYRLTELHTDGSSPWEPMTISVGKYPDGLRLIEQTSIAGSYKIFSAPNPSARWHLAASGTLPDCVSKYAFCWGLEGHPELSVPGSVFVSYKDPNSGPGGHVVVSAVQG
jgi:hypothetical protein